VRRSAQARVDYLFTSDVHLNPMDDPKLTDLLAAAPIAQWDGIFASDARPLANYLADTNASLFHLALAQMRATVPNPQVVLISGDFLAHKYREQWKAAASDNSNAAFDAFVDKTIAYIAQEFNAAFPNAQFVITLGNNDSPCGRLRFRSAQCVSRALRTSVATARQPRRPCAGFCARLPGRRRLRRNLAERNAGIGRQQQPVVGVGRMVVRPGAERPQRHDRLAGNRRRRVAGRGAHVGHRAYPAGDRRVFVRYQKKLPSRSTPMRS